MANAILPNSEMEVRDRKPYKLCLLSLCQTGAQSLSNCKIIQKLSDVLNYCKTNIDISIKTVKCTPQDMLEKLKPEHFYLGHP